MNKKPPIPCEKCIAFATCLSRYREDLPKQTPDPFIPMESIFYFMNECPILLKWVIEDRDDKEECFREFSMLYNTKNK